MVRSYSPNASVQKTGGNVTITGKSNSNKLAFSVTPAEENGLTLLLPANYTAAGAAGLVPAPAAGKQTSFLRGDGTWVVPTNTTYGLASTTANGLLRQLNGSTSSFMRGDGTWATPPNTTYAVANESTNGLMAAADKKTMNRLIGVNTVTTLAHLPISKRSITATLSAAATLSVRSGMPAGLYHERR